MQLGSGFKEAEQRRGKEVREGKGCGARGRAKTWADGWIRKIRRVAKNRMLQFKPHLLSYVLYTNVYVRPSPARIAGHTRTVLWQLVNIAHSACGGGVS